MAKKSGIDLKEYKWRRSPIGAIIKDYQEDYRKTRHGYKTPMEGLLAGKHPQQGRLSMMVPLISQTGTPFQMFKYKVKLPYPIKRKEYRKVKDAFPGLGLGAGLGPVGPLGPDLVLEIDINRQYLDKVFVPNIDTFSTLFFKASGVVTRKGKAGILMQEKTKARHREVSRRTFISRYKSGQTIKHTEVHPGTGLRYQYGVNLLALRFQKLHRMVIEAIIKQTVNKIVPKDTGDLRKSIAIGLRIGSEDVVDFPIRSILLTDLAPYKGLWSGDTPEPKAMWNKPIMYAGPVNNMPNEWLRHYMENKHELKIARNSARERDIELWERWEKVINDPNAHPARKRNAREAQDKWMVEERQKLRTTLGFAKKKPSVTYNERKYRAKGQKKRKMYHDREDTRPPFEVIRDPLFDPFATKGFWGLLLLDLRDRATNIVRLFLQDIRNELTTTLGINKRDAHNYTRRIFKVSIGNKRLRL